MPVLINKESGLAEDVPDYQSALNSGGYELPLYDPQGNFGSAPHTEASGLLSQGYRQPTTEELTHHLKIAKHSTGLEQVKTGVEGAAEAATMGLSAGVERALFDNADEMQGRAEANPGTRMVGQVAGLVGSQLALPGGGVAGLMGKAGDAAVEAAGLGAAQGLLPKASAAAIKQAAEMAILQSGDEVAKAFHGDPQTTMESAVTSVGLASLIGAGFGGGLTLATEPLFNAVKGSKIANTLSLLRDKTAGGLYEDNSLAVLEQTAKTKLPVELRAAMLQNPALKTYAEDLIASGTSAGDMIRMSMDKAKTDIGDSVVQAMGRKTEDALANDVSEYQVGQKVRDSLSSSLETQTKPIEEAFGTVKTTLKDLMYTQGEKNALAENLTGMAMRENYLGSQKALVDDVLKQLHNVNSVEGLRTLISRVGEISSTPDMYAVGKAIRNVLREEESNAIEMSIKAKAPELLEVYSGARSGYRTLMDKIDTLNDKLHLGKVYGPGSFVKAIKEADPEMILKRLSGLKAADFTGFLEESFPGVVSDIKNYQLDKMVQAASRGSEGVNPRMLFKQLDRLSPEARDFLLTKEQQAQLKANKELLDMLPRNANPSGSATMWDKMMKFAPGGLSGTLFGLTGHSPLMGFLTGQLGRMASREAPDAMKLALLKFLGAEGPVEASAFKTMFHAAETAYKSARTMDKAVGSVFIQGERTLVDRFTPTPQSVEKLQNILKAAQTDPVNTLDTKDNLHHYLPEQASARTQMASNVLQYLDHVKPKAEPLSPLEGPAPLSAPDKAQYERSLMIAQQPLYVLQAVKDGSITTRDLQDISSMYPKLYTSLQQQLLSKIMDHKASGKASIPYQAKIGMSLFMGQPLDASIMPQNVMANAALGLPHPQQQPHASRGSRTHINASQAMHLDKLPSSNMTKGQYAASRRLK